MPRHALSASLTILFCAVVALQAQTAATPAASAKPAAAVRPSPTPSIDPLDALAPADVQRALDFIKKNYVTPAAHDEEHLARATLAGLIEQSGRGISLSAKDGGAKPAPAPLYQEVIADHIGYLRPGALRKDDLNDLDNALRGFAAKKMDAIILDLRAATESTDFATAVEFAKRFVPRGQELFALRENSPGEEKNFTSDRSPSFTGFLSVLIDEETRGAAEVLASVLRARAKAILIGQPTAGAAVDYSELALGEGMVLRVAVAQAVLTEQSAPSSHGVDPDVPVAMSLAVKRQIFTQSLTNGMAGFVFEDDQPHLNEAALLAGTNPEIEALQERQNRRARGEKPVMHDAVVQRAVDLITSIGVYAARPGHAP